MRTPKERAESLLAHIQQVVDARIRPMMGEYILYVNDKVIGQINHSQLFIKTTPFGEGFAKDLQKESPYDGAKPAFIVPQSKLEDLSWLRKFLTGTVDVLEVKQKTIKSVKPKKIETINGFQIKYHANGVTLVERQNS